jgi:hypothetical protein
MASAAENAETLQHEEVVTLACQPAKKLKRGEKQEAKQDGPQIIHNSVAPVLSLDVDDKNAGRRDPCPERIAELTQLFLDGGFGISVTCGIQILGTESSTGKRLVDDGVSTVTALLQQCFKRKEEHPNCPTTDGEPWSLRLVDIFLNGLSCTVVNYADNNDRDVREAWNVARHAEESNKVRWSSVFQKLCTCL